MTEKYLTLGEALDMSIARAEAEMKAGRKILSIDLPAPDGVVVLLELEKHLIEAVDALIDAAGSFGGIERKRRVLAEAANRHGIDLR